MADNSIVQTQGEELLSDLVSIDSQNLPGKDRLVVGFIVDMLTEWG